MRPDAPGLDRIRSLVTDHNKVAPIARLLGARVLSVEEAALRSSAGTEYARSSSVGAIRRPTPK